MSSPRVPFGNGSLGFDFRGTELATASFRWLITGCPFEGHYGAYVLGASDFGRHDW